MLTLGLKAGAGRGESGGGGERQEHDFVFLTKDAFCRKRMLSRIAGTSWWVLLPTVVACC